MTEEQKAKKREYSRVYMRGWRARHKERNYEVQRNWIERNRLKNKAHHKVDYALRIGVLMKERCKECGREAHAHHEDYSKPLEVLWLCPKHHLERHAIND